MPPKPRWFAALPSVSEALATFPRPLVERSDVERLLGVGRRRAQQILEGCATGRVGSSFVTTPQALSAWLNSQAPGDEAHYERRRRMKVARLLADLQRDWTESPRVPVEAPVLVVNNRLGDLPPGVDLSAGEVRVRFRTAEEGLSKLLALAMAIGNDFEAFEQRTSTVDR